MDNLEKDKEELDEKTPLNTDQEETKYQSVPDIDDDKAFQKKEWDTIVHFILIKCQRSERNKGCKIKSVTINGKDKEATEFSYGCIDLLRFSSISNPWEKNQSIRTLSFFDNIKEKAAFENIKLSSLPEPFNKNDKNPLLLSPNKNNTFESFQINLSWYDGENDKECGKSDNINIKYNDITWDRVSFKEHEGIEAHFEYQYNEYVTIYSEYIRISSMPGHAQSCWNGHWIRWRDEDLREIFNGYLNEDERPKGEDGDKWRSATCLSELQRFIDLQFYYIEDFNREPLHWGVLIIETDVISKSSVFCGSERVRTYYDRDHPLDYQNITEPLWLAERYSWIKDECLHGQDEEFNIFRSLCFVGVNEPKIIYIFKLSIGILCVILQIILTIGIVMEVIDTWDAEQMFENDIMIITISFIVFSFISYTYIFTVDKFYQFYKNMSYVANISCFIIGLDFVSNIIIGFVICLVSFAYLLESDDIGDVVLNSFALTFIIQLDDLANLFESDEDVLMKDDFAHYLKFEGRGDYDPIIRKRVIKIPFRTILLCLILVLFSPLFIVVAVFGICSGSYQHYKTWVENNALDVLFRTKRKINK